LPERFLRRVWVEATQLAEPAHVVGYVLHPDLGLGSNQANSAHQGAVHIVGLRAEDVFDSNPHGGLGPVAALGLFAQRFAALALAVDAALQAPGTQLAAVN